MPDYQLVALDLDGTLFNNSSKISEKNLAAIQRITGAGITVVLSTGRPLLGLPFAQIENTGIDYAITANGSAIYRLSTRECLFEETMDTATVLPMIEVLLAMDLHIVAFIGGRGYTPIRCASAGDKLPLPAELKTYVTKTRVTVDDLPACVREHKNGVQKITLNFYQDPDGTFVDRERARLFLESRPEVSCVCGGYHNLEFTRAGVDKGRGLTALAQWLHIDPAAAVAIGDTENDLAILEAAGLGIAMGNATPAVRSAADYVTDTNERDGVAAALMHVFPELF